MIMKAADSQLHQMRFISAENQGQRRRKCLKEDKIVCSHNSLYLVEEEDVMKEFMNFKCAFQNAVLAYLPFFFLLTFPLWSSV